MLYALASLFYWVTLWLPLPVVVQPMVMLVDLAPRWLVFLPICLLPFGKVTRRKVLLYTSLSVVNIFFVMDFKLNWASSPPAGAQIVRVGAYNIGGGDVDYAKLLAWYRYQELDVLLLQEAREERLRPLLTDDFTLDCYGQLCTLSHHGLIPELQLDRRIMNGYGRYAASYQFQFNGRALPLVNVHLNTPRHALDTQRAPITNRGKFQRLFQRQAVESMLASELVKEGRETAIIAGDFNLTQQSTLYRRYWRDWRNSFSEAGFGLGRTKHSRFLGARIDHIIVGEGLKVHSSKVHPSMGGDHSPVVAVLSVL